MNETITHEIDAHEVERLELTATGEFDVIQHIEQPDSPVHVTEHRLSEFRLLLRQLFLCVDLLDPSPVLLGPFDTGYPILIGETSRQEN